MKGITPKEALKILHPDTSRDALWKIEYYAGFNAEKARLKAVEDACVVACEALEKQIPQKYDEWNGQASFPCCQKLFGSIETLKSLIKWEMPYCKFCGQALDWSE